MGFRFRRSVKIAPGVKLNFGKKSSSISLGTRGAHYTINSKGQRTKSVGIPGTGVSYTSTSRSNRSKKGRKHTSAQRSSKQTGSCLMNLLYFLGIIAIFGIAVALFSLVWIPAIILLVAIPFIKIEKRSKIISEIVVIVIGILSAALFFNTADSKKKDASLPNQSNSQMGLISETEFLTETEIPAQTEPATEIHTETELITEFSSEHITESEPSVVYPVTRFVTDTINVRDNPGTDSTIVGSLSKRDTVQIQSMDGEWAQILYNGTAAYVAAEYLSETPPQTEPGKKLVWLPASGAKYHSNKTCSGMNAVRQVTVDEAVALGYEPCSKC